MKKSFVFYLFLLVSHLSYAQIDTASTATPLDGRGVWVRVSSSYFSSAGYVNDSTRGLVKGGIYFVRQMTSEGSWPLEYAGVKSTGSESTNASRLRLLISRNYSNNMVAGSDSTSRYMLTGSIDFSGKSLTINPGAIIGASSSATISNAIIYTNLLYKSFDTTIQFSNCTFVNGLSPEMFGGISNGSSNTTRYIQRAIDVASLNRGTVYLSGRTYAVPGVITMKDNVVLSGLGGNEVYMQPGFYLKYDDAGADNVTIKNVNFRQQAASGFNFSELILLGSESTESYNTNFINNNIYGSARGNWGIRPRRLKKALLENILLEDIQNTGIMIDSCINIAVNKSNLYRMGRGGICAWKDNDDFKFDGNSVFSWMIRLDLTDGAYDVYGSSNKNGIITNNYAFSDTAGFYGPVNQGLVHTGIRIQGGEEIHAYGNTLEFVGTHFLYAARDANRDAEMDKNNSITNNIIILRGNYQYIFSSQGAWNSNFSENKIYIKPTAVASAQPFLIYINQHSGVDTVKYVNMKGITVSAGGKPLYFFFNRTPVKTIDFSGSNLDSIANPTTPASPLVAYFNLDNFKMIGGSVSSIDASDALFAITASVRSYQITGIDVTKANNRFIKWSSSSFNTAILNVTGNVINNYPAPNMGGGVSLTSSENSSTSATLSDTVGVFYGTRVLNQTLTLPTTEKWRGRSLTVVKRTTDANYILVTPVSGGNDTVLYQRPVQYHFDGAIWTATTSNKGSGIGGGVTVSQMNDAIYAALDTLKELKFNPGISEEDTDSTVLVRIWATDYTPTITNQVNCSVPSTLASYSRTGDQISFYATYSVTHTAASTNTSFRLSLPFNADVFKPITIIVNNQTATYAGGVGYGTILGGTPGVANIFYLSPTNDTKNVSILIRYTAD